MSQKSTKYYFCFLFKTFFFDIIDDVAFHNDKNDEKIMISVLAACYWLKELFTKNYGILFLLNTFWKFTKIC